MKITKTALDGVVIIEPQVFEDARGYFFESWNKAKMEEAGLNYDFIQDNQSKSCYGTIRGIHFQKGEFSQAKLVRVIEGTVLDVAVDLRRGSPTFGKYMSVELSGQNKRQFYIPQGFAHGFQTLVDETEIFYQMSTFYHPESSRGVRWNDPAFGIQWPETERAILSDRDRVWPDYTDSFLI